MNPFFDSPSVYLVQKTLKNEVTFSGVGLHTGVSSHIRLIPAAPNHGIVFEKRCSGKKVRVVAHYDAVVATELATSLGLQDVPNARIGTVEHLLSVLFALGIQNLLIEIEGPEIPILDGSGQPFLQSILDKGIQFQPYSTPILRVLKPIKIYQGGAICELLPRQSLRLTTSVDFPHPSIGLQTYAIDLTPQTYIEEIVQARTFGFSKDLDRLREANLALGASLENVLAFSETAVLNPDGLRYPDECVRHKLLDAIGDLALCGCWIQGELVSFRGGHSIHLSLLKTIREKPSHWEILPAEPMPLRSGAYAESGVPLRVR